MVEAEKEITYSTNLWRCFCGLFKEESESLPNPVAVLRKGKIHTIKFIAHQVVSLDLVFDLSRLKIDQTVEFQCSYKNGNTAENWGGNFFEDSNLAKVKELLNSLKDDKI